MIFAGPKKENASVLAYIQPQLEIGKEEDDHEKEANHVADKVMRMTDHDEDKEKKKMTDGESNLQMMSDTSAGKVQLMVDSPSLIRKMGDDEKTPGKKDEPAKEKSREEQLAAIKNGDYDDSPDAKYEAARKVWAAYSYEITMDNFNPADKKLLENIIDKYHKDCGPVEEEPVVKKACPVKQDYNEDDIRKAAEDIVRNDAGVRKALLFFSRIREYTKGEKEQEAELYLFLDDKGENRPRIHLTKGKTSGGTPERFGPMKRKKTSIDSRSSFSRAVATYLHEMNHYLDIWYASKAAKDQKRKMAETKGKGASGINPVEKDDLSVADQKTAMGEYLDAEINGIMQDILKDDKQPNEHLLTETYRKEYKTFLKNNEQKWLKKPESKQKDLDKELARIRREAERAAKGAYKDYGAKVTKGVFSETKVEFGFAFEKMAYGFYDGKDTTGAWAVGFVDKFEDKYCEYLQ